MMREVLLLVVCVFATVTTSAPHNASTTGGLIETQVVGGSVVDWGEFPYMVSLQRIIFGMAFHICGAAVYNHFWVISAAHCLNQINPLDGSLRVVAGEHKLNSFDGSEQTIYVDKAILHEGFDPLTNRNDIVLLKLEHSITYGIFVQPISIPPSGFQPEGHCVFSGWGATTESGSVSNTPNKANLPIISDLLCEMYYVQTAHVIAPSMLCAGYEEGGTDACSYDDGGPLVCNSGREKYLTGISSFGIGCAKPYLPGVYTEVSHYSEWIQQLALT